VAESKSSLQIGLKSQQAIGFEDSSELIWHPMHETILLWRLSSRLVRKGLTPENDQRESRMFGFLGVPAGIQPEIPAPKSETCCISDSNIPNFNATLRDSF
jgi:hypothetical protein